MNLAHHIEQHFVGRVSAMHAACEFGRCEISNNIPAIIELGIVVLQPGVKLESQQASIDLVASHVRDWTDAEKRVKRRSRYATGGGHNRGLSLGL